MFLSWVRPERISLPITTTQAVTIPCSAIGTPVRRDRAAYYAGAGSRTTLAMRANGLDRSLRRAV